MEGPEEALAGGGSARPDFASVGDVCDNKVAEAVSSVV